METPGNNITGYQDLAIAENRQMREDDIKRSKGKVDYLAETSVRSYSSSYHYDCSYAYRN